MIEFKLISSDMFYTPNLIRFIASEAKFDRKIALSILNAGWPDLTEEARSNIFEGNFKIVDDTVLVMG